jgi:hypothetical protein
VKVLQNAPFSGETAPERSFFTYCHVLEADIGQASEGVDSHLQTSAMIRTTPHASRQPSASRRANPTNLQDDISFT